MTTSSPTDDTSLRMVSLSISLVAEVPVEHAEKVKAVFRAALASSEELVGQVAAFIAEAVEDSTGRADFPMTIAPNVASGPVTEAYAAAFDLWRHTHERALEIARERGAGDVMVRIGPLPTAGNA